MDYEPKYIGTTPSGVLYYARKPGDEDALRIRLDKHWTRAGERRAAVLIPSMQTLLQQIADGSADMRGRGSPLRGLSLRGLISRSNQGWTITKLGRYTALAVTIGEANRRTELQRRITNV